MSKIRVGFIGAGWMGKALLGRLCQRDDVEIRALAGRNPDHGNSVLRELGLSLNLYTTNCAQVLNDPAIDAVFIATPNGFHGAQAIAAMRAGKHVFCEKPAATTCGEFYEQIDLERANPGSVTFVDYILYFDAMEDRLRQMVARNAFGTITQVQINYRHPVNIAGEKIWKLSKEIMGDAIGMGIIHSLSVMVWLMASQARPAAVFASSQKAKVRNFEPEPIWSIHIRFDNGATGFCFGNIDNGNGYDAYHNLYGTEGAFVFDSGLDRPQKVRYWSAPETGGNWIYPLDDARCRKEGAEGLAWPADTSTPDSSNVIEHQTGACVGHFIASIKSGTQSPLSFANSAIIGEIGWAAQMSASTGKEVMLPLDRDATEKFFALGADPKAGAIGSS